MKEQKRFEKGTLYGKMYSHVQEKGFSLSEKPNREKVHSWHERERERRGEGKKNRFKF